MAEVTGLRNNALGYPVYGVPWGVVFPLLDADGDLVTGASTPDAERSLNGDTFADCTNESTEIATNSGMYYLLLTAAEMTADVVAVIAKSATAGMKTTPIVLYPRKLVTLRSGTVGANAADGTTLQLDGSASAVDDFYNGCLLVGTLDSNVEARMITDYVGSTKVCTVSPAFVTTPDNNDTFVVYDTEQRQIRGADLAAIGAAAVSTSTAQLGVNVAQAGGTAWGSGAITAASIADGAIDAATFAADVDAEILSYLVDDATRIDASALNTATGTTIPAIVADTNELQTDWANGGRLDLIVDAILDDTDLIDDGTSGLAKIATDVAAILVDTSTTLQAELDGIQADTEDIQSRLPTALVGGRIDATVDGTGMEAGAVSAIQSGLATAANLATVAGYLDTEIAAILADTNELQTDLADGGRLDLLIDAIKAKTDNLPSDPADASVIAGRFDTLDTSIADVESKVDDLETRLGTPSDLGSGATVAANLVDIEAQTDNLPGIETKIDTIDDLLDTEVAAIKTVVDAVKVETDKLADTLEDQGGGTYGFTEAALQEAPSGSGLDAAGVRAAVGLASANLDTQLGDLPTNAELSTALGTADDAVLAAIAALQNLSASGAASAVLTTQMTESYAANGVSPTLAQAIFAIHQHLMSFAISGTSKTVKKLDGSTEAFVETLDDDTSPTALTRVA